MEREWALGFQCEIWPDADPKLVVQIGDDVSCRGCTARLSHEAECGSKVDV